jgi:hypothetical protein
MSRGTMSRSCNRRSSSDRNSSLEVYNRTRFEVLREHLAELPEMQETGVGVIRQTIFGQDADAHESLIVHLQESKVRTNRSWHRFYRLSIPWGAALILRAISALRSVAVPLPFLLVPT